MQGTKQASFGAVVVLSVAATTASCSQTANLEIRPGRGPSVVTAPTDTEATALSAPQTFATPVGGAVGSGDARARGGQAFKRALDRLGAARTAVYRIDLNRKDGAIQLSDEVTTDVLKGIDSHRVHKRQVESGRATDAYLRVVRNAEGHGWEVTTDADGRPVGTWHRLTPSRRLSG